MHVWLEAAASCNMHARRPPLTRRRLKLPIRSLQPAHNRNASAPCRPAGLVVPEQHRLHQHRRGGAHPVSARDDLREPRLHLGRSRGESRRPSRATSTTDLRDLVVDRVDEEEVRDEGEVEAYGRAPGRLEKEAPRRCVLKERSRPWLPSSRSVRMCVSVRRSSHAAPSLGALSGPLAPSPQPEGEGRNAPCSTGTLPNGTGGERPSQQGGQARCGARHAPHLAHARSLAGSMSPAGPPAGGGAAPEGERRQGASAISGAG